MTVHNWFAGMWFAEMWFAGMRRAAVTLGALGVMAVVAGCAGGHRAGLGPERGAQVAKAAPVVKPEPAKPDWSQHFKNVSKGAILVSLDERRLAYWAPGGKEYKEFPIAVPRSADLEKRGRTRVVRRRKNPDWRPTPSMLRRNPNQPKYIGPGPHNPLGERALYLGWRYYAIHGTNNPHSIGTMATSGCFRMYPQHIEWLYDQTPVGVPVRVVDSVPELQSRRASLRAINDPTALAERVYRQPTTRAPRKVVQTRAPRFEAAVARTRARYSTAASSVRIVEYDD